MEKKRMTRSKAEAIVKEASDALFDALKKLGIAVEEGELDGEGRPFTAKRVKRIRQEVDAASRDILEESYIIEEG